MIGMALVKSQSDWCVNCIVVLAEKTDRHQFVHCARDEQVCVAAQALDMGDCAGYLTRPVDMKVLRADS